MVYDLAWLHPYVIIMQAYTYSGVGNRLDFHNQSSVWPMIDAILKIFSHGLGQGSDINHHSIRDIDKNLPNVDVLRRRHCDISVDYFLF